MRGVLVSLALMGLAGGVFAQETLAPPLEVQKAGMSLWQLIKSGGVIMIILGALSVVALALIIYHFIVLREENFIRRGFVERLNQLVAKRDLEGARRLCEEDGGILARIVLEGLETAEEDRLAVHDAIESAGARETTRLLQQVGYLSDIAVLSPMLGILGTVLGMIQAFNAIAFKLEAVKPIALAAGVAKALVTTAAGLVVAIPVMGFYFYFRAKLNNIIASLEGVASEIAQNISLGGRRR